MKNYVNSSSAPIYLAPLRKSDREAHKLLRRITQRDLRLINNEEYGPDIEGRYGDPCPKCGMTRILFIPGLPDERWRCCGVRVELTQSKL